MGEKLFRVRALESGGFGQVATHVSVASADDKHEALDIVKESDEYALYDEPIQRAIVNGEIKQHRIQRKYADYIEEIEAL